MHGAFAALQTSLGSDESHDTNLRGSMETLMGSALGSAEVKRKVGDFFGAEWDERFFVQKINFYL